MFFTRNTVQENSGDRDATIHGKVFAILLASYLLIAAALSFEDVRATMFAFAIPLLILPIALACGNLVSSKLKTLTLLAIAVFLLEAVFRVRAYDEKVVDLQILVKVASWLILLSIAAGNLGVVLRVTMSTACLPWTITFTYFLLTSIYAPNPTHSAVAALSILSFYVFFASLHDRISYEDALLAILAGITALAIASLIVYFANPGFGRMKIWAGNEQVLSSRLSGLAGHANTIGRLCCFGLLVVVSQWERLKTLWKPAPLFCLFTLTLTLLLSNSRSSILITFILVAIYIFARARFLPYFVFIVFGVCITAIVLAPYSEQIMQLLARSGKAEEIETGTSRTHIWAVAELLISQKPWLGWGYGSSVFIMPPYQSLMGHLAPHAHNVFLQLWMTTGLVGLCLFVFASASRLFIALHFKERFIGVLFLFVILNGLTESSAFGGVANITTIALCVATTTFRARQDASVTVGKNTTVSELK